MQDIPRSNSPFLFDRREPLKRQQDFPKYREVPKRKDLTKLPMPPMHPGDKSYSDMHSSPYGSVLWFLYVQFRLIKLGKRFQLVIYET